MASEPRPDSEGGKSGNATTAGGASTDRGGRDAGMPGPAEGTETAGAQEVRKKEESGRKPTDGH